MQQAGSGVIVHVTPPEALVGAVEPAAIPDVIAFLVSDSAASISGAIVPTYLIPAAARIERDSDAVM